MRTIWKYEIPIQDRFTLMLPVDARILSVQTQAGRPYVWALFDKNLANATENRHFRLAGTGHEIEVDDSRVYVGTFQTGPLVFHLFEAP